jgi:hypothetical protein
VNLYKVRAREALYQILQDNNHNASNTSQCARCNFASGFLKHQYAEPTSPWESDLLGELPVRDVHPCEYKEESARYEHHTREHVQAPVRPVIRRDDSTCNGISY